MTYEEVLLWEEDGVYHANILGRAEATGDTEATALRNLADKL